MKKPTDDIIPWDGVDFELIQRPVGHSNEPVSGVMSPIAFSGTLSRQGETVIAEEIDPEFDDFAVLLKAADDRLVNILVAVSQYTETLPVREQWKAWSHVVIGTDSLLDQMCTDLGSRYEGFPHEVLQYLNHASDEAPSFVPLYPGLGTSYITMRVRGQLEMVRRTYDWIVELSAEKKHAAEELERERGTLRGRLKTFLFGNAS